MVDKAFLVGVGSYPDHPQPVTNDLALIAQALAHRGYASSDVRIFDNTHTTRSSLVALFADVREACSAIDSGSIYVHVSASGTLSFEPLAGGILPTDRTKDDFTTAVPLAVLNDCLPTKPNVLAIVTLDC